MKADLKLPAKRSARVTGQSLWRANPPGQEIHGSIEVERRDDCMYYGWRIQDSQGELLGEHWHPVSFKVIPKDADPFEYALSHAVEGLRRYRMDRKKYFRNVRAEWQ